jgi:hypothetical protein
VLGCASSCCELVSEDESLSDDELVLDETLLLLLLEVDVANCLARLWEEEEEEVEEEEEEEEEEEDEDDEVARACFLFRDAMVAILGPCGKVNHGLFLQSCVQVSCGRVCEISNLTENRRKKYIIVDQLFLVYYIWKWIKSVQACYSTTSTLRLRPEGNQCSIVYHHFLPLRMDTKVLIFRCWQLLLP